MEYRQDIQILRGIAVLFVLFYHLQIPFFQNGYLGVDVFFVISGFLMAKLYNRGSITDFYKRRIDRLLPAYAVTIIGALIVGLFVLIPPDFNQLFDQSISSTFFASNFHFWYQNSYFSASEFNPLLNLWSLAVEAQFYLIVPFLYPLLRNRRWLLALTIILSFLACVFIQSLSPKTSFFLMPFRVWEFLLGAYVAWHINLVAQKGRALEIVRTILPALMIGFLLIVTLKPNDLEILTGHPGLGALFVCLLTAGIVALGLPTFCEKRVIGKGLVKIGDYSYSIYLVHFPVIVLMNYKIFGGTALAFDSYQMMGAAVILIAILSYLSYHFVENRGRKIFNTNARRFGLLTLVIAIAAITFQFNKNNYTPREQNIFAGLEDRAPYRCGKIFRILNPMSDICPIGQVFDQNILLVGDSHADAMKMVIADVANAANTGVYFYVDNDPLVKAALPPTKIIDDALRLEVNKIILHFNNKYKNEAFRAKILELSRIAKEKGLKVTLIGLVPAHNLGVPKAMYQQQDLMLSRAEYKEQTSDFRDLAPQLRAQGVSIIDPAEVLCPATQSNCQYADEAGRPYYFDSHHLTLTGIKLLEPLFTQKLLD